MGFIQRWRRPGLAAFATGLVLLWAPGAGLARDFFGADFEAFTGIPRDAVSAIPDGEMDDLRGGFLGFFFEVSFAGFVELDGAATGVLSVNAAFGEDTATLTLDGVPDGTTTGGTGTTVALGDLQVATSATIGEAFSGAQGVFQISQIPGMGSVIQGLTINLAIIEASDSSLGSLRSQLSPLFGL